MEIETVVAQAETRHNMDHYVGSGVKDQAENIPDYDIDGDWLRRSLQDQSFQCQGYDQCATELPMRYSEKCAEIEGLPMPWKL